MCFNTLIIDYALRLLCIAHEYAQKDQIVRNIFDQYTAYIVTSPLKPYVLSLRMHIRVYHMRANVECCCVCGVLWRSGSYAAQACRACRSRSFGQPRECA